MMASAASAGSDTSGEGEDLLPPFPRQGQPFGAAVSRDDRSQRFRLGWFISALMGPIHPSASVRGDRQEPQHKERSEQHEGAEEQALDQELEGLLAHRGRENIRWKRLDHNKSGFDSIRYFAAGVPASERGWTSHTFTVSSALAEASRFPSGLNATQKTALECPLQVSISWPVVASHNFTV